MAFSVDTSELDRLVADMEAAPGRIQRGTARLLERSSVRVQAGMRKDASGHRHLRQLPRTVGRDRVGVLEYEVGFDRRGQGNLANIVVFGSINNGPVFSHAASLRRDAPILLHEAEQQAAGWVLADD